MPYKNRATRLEYMRNYYRMRIKPENELRRVNKGLKPTPKTSSSPYLSNDKALPPEPRAIPAQIASVLRISQAANSPAAKGSHGVVRAGVREQEERARRAGFIVDCCGNAWRIVKPDEC